MEDFNENVSGWDTFLCKKGAISCAKWEIELCNLNYMYHVFHVSKSSLDWLKSLVTEFFDKFSLIWTLKLNQDNINMQSL